MVKQNINLYLASPRGFCAGVDRAVKIVEKAIKSKIHVIIIFYVYGYEKITFEDLCKLTNSTVSRTTIQTILSEGVKLGYLKKFVDKEDKRKKYFSCEQLKPILEKWHNQQQKIFN